MASTKFAVIYSKNTGRIRWIFKSDDDSEHSLIKLQNGEAMIELPNEQYGNHLDLQPIISSKIGITPTNDRYVIVDPEGNVIGAIIADPLCGDAIPNQQLIPHSTAGPGWTHANGVLTPPKDIRLNPNL